MELERKHRDGVEEKQEKKASPRPNKKHKINCPFYVMVFDHLGNWTELFATYRLTRGELSDE